MTANFFGMIMVVSLLFGCGGGDPGGVGSIPDGSVPTASISAPATSYLGAKIQLDGSGSLGSTGSSLIYSWVLLSAPAGSSSAIDNSTSQQPFFIADRVGDYQVSLVVTSAGHSNAPAIKSLSVIYSYLADTGQTLSYTTTQGEDSDYSGRALSFTDMGNGTVVDSNTGLSWQKTPDMVNRTYPAAQSYCTNLTLGGVSDWRLPNKKEMMGILNYGSNPTIDSAFYSDSSFQEYWTSPFTNGVGLAWLVSTTYGWAIIMDGINLEKTRCVSGHEITYGALTDNNDGSVSDATTQLQWVQGETSPMTWEGAITYCENLDFDGHTDWRLPNIKEIGTLTQETVFIDGTTGNSAALDYLYFPDSKQNERPGMNPYWSSTSGSTSPTEAWVINFTTGYAITYPKVASYSVRCVRGAL